MRTTLLLAVGAVLAATGAPAQTSPFLPEPLYRHLASEISGDRAFEDIRELSRYHRTGGSRDFFVATESIRATAQAAGLEDVKLIRQPWNEHDWSCLSGEAWLLGPEEVKLASYAAVPVSIADHSRTTHVSADVVDVGAGTSDKDYQGRDVRGKIVLASGPVGAVHREAVWKRGALGVLSDMTQRPDLLDAPDQVAWGRLPYEAKGVDGVKDGAHSTFAVMISPRRGRWLAARLASAQAPLQLKVDIEASYPEVQEQAMVEGWIHGTEIHDQQILLTAHIQEERSAANDDGSGCASMLEIARSLVRLVRDGKIPRPRRDIRFWWVNELASEPEFVRQNPKEPRRMLLDIQQDMVGARQSFGGRVQYASRLPWSLPHALEDVVESILTMVRDGNTSLLTTRGTALPAPFTREILSVKGSREPYHARMVPYYGLSDHQFFTAAPVGVPATALINWPDEYIHSSDDDLENIDATQLQRNAVVVAGVALYFASLQDDEAAALAAHVAARARVRVAGDVATAVAHLAEASPAARDAAYRDARNLVHESTLKELSALASVRRLASKGRAPEIVAQLSSRLEEGEASDLAFVERAAMAITGKNPPNVDLTPEERTMAARVYVPTRDVAVFHEALARSRDRLHGALRFEIYNFADGKRSALGIFNAVSAEALSAGSWYYGAVTPAEVLAVLDAGVRAGAFTVKGNK